MGRPSACGCPRLWARMTRQAAQQGPCFGPSASRCVLSTLPPLPLSTGMAAARSSCVSPNHMYRCFPTACAVFCPHAHSLQVLAVLSHIDDWAFDSFELASVTEGRPLTTLAFTLIKRSGIMDCLKLDEGKLAR